MSAGPSHGITRGRAVVPWLWGGVALALVVWWGALAWDVIHARADANAVTSYAAQAQDAVAVRDVEALRESVESLSQASRSFAGHTSGLHWWLAAQIPWVSDQVRPLRAAGSAVQALADDALAPLSDLQDLDGLANPEFVDGRIDPLLLEPYRPTLEEVHAVLHREGDTLAAVDTTHTVRVIRDAFDSLTGQLASLTGTVDGATALAELMPGMLGGDGSRTYAVMLQNNAEPRAAGGIPGAVILVTVNDGRLQMGEYFSAADLNRNDELIDAAISEQEQIAFSDLLREYVQDVTLTPQFPRAAELLSAFVERRTGTAPDGVVSIDPVALGYMLADAPTRDIAGIEVGGSNLADVMLNGAYFAFPQPSDQDAFFALAAGTLFGDILDGGPTVIDGLQRAIAEDRFAVWSAVPAEQETLATTSAGGDMLRDEVWSGVFVNDASGAKIGYYARIAATMTVDRCDAADRVVGASMEIAITHGFDGEVATLPGYVTGNGVYVPEGQFVANLMFLVPPHYVVTHLTVDGVSSDFGSGIVADRWLAWPRVTLEPGQTSVLVFELSPLEAASDPGSVSITPGAKPDSNTIAVEILHTNC